LDFLESLSAFFMQSRCAASPDMFLQACLASSLPVLRLARAAPDAESGLVVGFSRKVGCVGGVDGEGAVGWAAAGSWSEMSSAPNAQICEDFMA
jgi:hypothetical protein